MKTVRDVMTTDVVWVSPTQRVKSAVLLVKGHGIGALPVVSSNDSVVGVCTCHGLLGEPQDIAVADVMETTYTIIEPNATVYDAVETMLQSKAKYLLVMEDEKLAGIVSHGDILPELGKTFDPLTQLPWSDSLRDWAMDSLKRGMEISVIFFDLNSFGHYNKKYGHVIGDRVLQEVAGVLKANTDTDTDLVCRYGGDEFVIVSARLADEAIALGDDLQQKISEISFEGLPEGVSASYGMFGGRRTKEREDMHYAATIDDLITRASKNCTANKPAKVEERPAMAAAQVSAAPYRGLDFTPYAPPAGPGGRLKINSIGFSTTDTQASVSVILTLGEQEFKREASGYAMGGKSMLRLVAEATAAAVCKSLEVGHGIVVDEVMLNAIDGDEELITVVANFIGPRINIRSAGTSIVRRGDRYRSTAAALLASVNRMLEVTPRRGAEEPEAGV